MSKTVILKPGKTYYALYNPFDPSIITIWKVKLIRYISYHQSIVEVIKNYKGKGLYNEGARYHTDTWRLFDSLSDIKKRVIRAQIEGPKEDEDYIFNNKYKVEE